MNLIKEHQEPYGIEPLCEALLVSRATYYRHLNPAPKVAPNKRPTPLRALSEEEKKTVIDLLHSERFIDLGPEEVYATLLDEGIYICHWRTMYRYLHEHQEVKDRRDQRRHPKHKAPELFADAPNQLWSWDITKLLGPKKWVYYYLYVLLDVFSRYVVGWLVADQESAALAEQLICDSYLRENIKPGQVTIHSDNGAVMVSKTLGQLMSDLEITPTHSRPYVSNDNPFSESQFKTTKYNPWYPNRFTGEKEEALLFCRTFFPWYNERHHHRGINLLTPYQLHHGEAAAVLAAREVVLQAAYKAHPERFVSGAPSAGEVPKEVWINKPKLFLP